MSRETDITVDVNSRGRKEQSIVIFAVTCNLSPHLSL